MKLITAVKEMREYSRGVKREGKQVGFVPTMGYLHEGHLSLIRTAREECDAVVVSIFVNPTQFGTGEDIERYPRDLERDKELAEKAGVDRLFTPSAEEIYPRGYITSVKVKGSLTDTMCARSRPGHFEGVATVVAKLFNIVEPDRSYFGQKDAQQAVVVKRMVKDLDLPVEIRVMPIVREEDGLAMSSRNTYLNPDEREQALGLFRSLNTAEKMVSDGELSAGRIKEEMTKVLKKGGYVKIDYIEIRDADSLEPLERVRDNTLIAVAAFVGETRLIDNIIINKN